MVKKYAKARALTILQKNQTDLRLVSAIAEISGKNQKTVIGCCTALARRAAVSRSEGEVRVCAAQPDVFKGQRSLDRNGYS